MTNKNEIYKCNICGNISEILHTGAGAMICCGEPMELQVEKKEEEGAEKHLPVVEKTEGGSVEVKVGDVPHPMEDAHYIEWVEVKTIDGKIGKKFLNAGDSVSIEFYAKTKIVEVRAYCNVHGLWKIVL